MSVLATRHDCSASPAPMAGGFDRRTKQDTPDQNPELSTQHVPSCCRIDGRALSDIQPYKNMVPGYFMVGITHESRLMLDTVGIPFLRSLRHQAINSVLPKVDRPQRPRCHSLQTNTRHSLTGQQNDRTHRTRTVNCLTRPVEACPIMLLER